MPDMPIEPPPPANRGTSEEGATDDMIAASAGNGGSGLEQPHSGGANPVAVAGFVCAICTVVLIWLVIVNLILGVLGLIFSWIGFNRAKKARGLQAPRTGIGRIDRRADRPNPLRSSHRRRGGR